MDSNVRTEQKHTVVNSPGQQREIVTERTERRPEKPGVSAGTIALIAILAVAAIGVVVYLVVNRNANDSANRNANVEVASQQPAQQPPAQQPAQQAPIIIQQPATAQPPVVIQQPAPSDQREITSANEDAKMQDLATKRLAEDASMAGIVVTVSDARAVLSGTVNSAATKAKAEQLVKSVRGVKSVDNKLVASS
jgi:hypothetical protein